MKKYILLLSALIISAAVFCGCDENVPTETSRFSSKSYSSAQSSAESSDEDAQSSGESAEAADSSKASEKSKPESAQPSKTDGSKEEKKSDEQLLTEYAANLQKEGEMKGKDGSKAYWKIKTTKVADLNNDSSPELIIQYDLGRDQSTGEQALAIEIIKYKKGDFLSYRTNSYFTDYLKDTGDKYIRHEYADELYIDGSGRLSVLSTCLDGDNLDSIVYNTYSIDGDQLVQTENLVVKKEEYIGSEKVDDIVHCVYGIVDNVPVIYRFSVQGEAHTTKLNSNTGLPLHAKMLEIQPVEEYKVSDAMSHSLEANEGYDTTAAQICNIEEAEQAYRNRPPVEEGEPAPAE